MAYYDALLAKWPSVAGATTAAKLANLNAQTVTGSAIPMVIPTYTIYNTIDPTEFGALSAANQQLIRDILGMGTVDASPGTSVRARIVAIFPTGTTRTALNALAAKYDSPSIPWWQGTIAQNGGALNGVVNQSDLTANGLS